MERLSKQKIKQIKRYQMKKYRKQDGLFLAEGKKIVSELILSKIKPKVIIFSDEWLEKNERIETSIACFATSSRDFQQISQQKTPDGVLAVCEIPNHNLQLTNQWSIALDNIQDPGNLGTIIRIADWFGIQNVICSNETVDAYSLKVVQATMGSIGRINVHYTNLEQFFQNSPLPVYGATLEGQSIYELLQPIEKGILLIGNESHGVQNQLKPYIQQEITIPLFGQAESLNAGVATGILISHLLK